MLLIYTPTSGDRREFVFDPTTVTVEDAEEIEALGGSAWRSYTEFAVAYAEGKVRALRVALFICMRRDNPPLTFGELSSFLANDIGKRYDTSELLAMRRLHLESEQDPDVIRTNVALIDSLLTARGETPPLDADEAELLDPKAEVGSSRAGSRKRAARSGSSAGGTDGSSQSSSGARPRSRTGGRSTSSRTPAT